MPARQSACWSCGFEAAQSRAPFRAEQRSHYPAAAASPRVGYVATGVQSRARKASEESAALDDRGWGVVRDRDQEWIGLLQLLREASSQDRGKGNSGCQHGWSDPSGWACTRWKSPPSYGAHFCDLTRLRSFYRCNGFSVTVCARLGYIMSGVITPRSSVPS